MVILSSPPEEFEYIWAGTKKADWRKFRKDYVIGNKLDIMEYDWKTKNYTGRWLRATVTHVQISPKLSMPEGFCILSFDNIERKILSSAQITALGKIGFETNKPCSNVSHTESRR